MNEAPTKMRKPISHETKRKIDSKIFELQSSLLETGAVTKALLAECALWFRPSHLEDIVIERSEAERRCGWPGCDKAITLVQRLSSSALAFGLPDEEELSRFCGRACMAKTRVLLSSIPSTSPCSREGVLRLVSPPPPPSAPAFEKEVAGTAGSSTKKIYKRPRRRDIISASKAAKGVPGAALALGERSEGLAARNGRDSSPPGVNGVHATESASADVAALDSEGAKRGNDKANDDCRVGDEMRDGVVETLQAEMGRVSISESARTLLPFLLVPPPFSSPTHAGAEGGEIPSAPQEATVKSPVTSASPPATTATAASIVPLRPPDGPSSWESMRFSRQSIAPSTVSLQAYLMAEAAAVAEAPEVIPAPSTSTTADMCTARAAVPPAVGVTATSSSHRVLRAEQEAESNNSKAGKSTNSSSMTTTARRKSVTFAEGTKEPPLDLTAVASSSGSSTSASGGVKRGRKGRGRGRGRLKTNGGVVAGETKNGVRDSGTGATAKCAVLESVVEREASVPTPMETKAVAMKEGKAKMIEGHLPNIETDISFRVLPRGHTFGGNDLWVGGAGGGFEEEKDGGLGAVNVKEEGLQGEDLAGNPLGGGEKEKEGANPLAGVEGAPENEDDEENDRRIWREDFGSEMTPEISEGSWMDMDVLHDKELREEFASSIGSFPLLWSAFSEWVTPDTRAVCRAGRDAAAAASAAARVVGPAAGTGKSLIGDLPSPLSCEQLRTRQAGAVAVATEAEARRRVLSERFRGVDATASDNAAAFAGPTITGALRHSGLSAMVNMHLGQAERLLLRGESAGVEGGMYAEKRAAAEEIRKWTWSKATAKGRPSGGGRPGGWSMEEPAARNPQVVAVEKKEIVTGGLAAGLTRAVGKDTSRSSSQGPQETKGQANRLRPPSPREAASTRRTRSVDWRGEGKDEKSFAVESGGDAGCRRALSAVIDTMDAGHASSAANLSIAQWKVVPLVLLTAIGLGGEIPRGGRDGILMDEATRRGAEACARLGGDKAIISAREFEMLVEVMLEE